MSFTISPHSLGKLIEWKQPDTIVDPRFNFVSSPLAGETH